MGLVLMKRSTDNTRQQSPLFPEQLGQRQHKLSLWFQTLKVCLVHYRDTEEEEGAESLLSQSSDCASSSSLIQRASPDVVLLMEALNYTTGITAFNGHLSMQRGSKSIYLPVLFFYLT